MTGYAQAHGVGAGMEWTVEVKSVNGRGLELRCRLPSPFDAFEPGVREVVARHLARGNVSVGLSIAAGTPDAGAVAINEALLARYVALAADLSVRHDLAKPSAADLLALPGVTVPAATALDEDGLRALQAAFLASVDQACAALDGSRAAEGQQLGVALAGLLDDIEAFIEQAQALAPQQPEALRQRLAERLAALDPAAHAVAPERLAQEIALLAAKADMREELDRLRAHLASARTLLAKPEPVGRAFEFLTQELLRETNTLCAKSADPALTRIGLDLKSAIEQVREQIKNIE
ncbi:MAG: YicC family protein [Alphaproteobacteria bacterium]|nr:MAG: YicC family protein [Alphaproteobacteria bacterium]